MCTVLDTVKQVNAASHVPAILWLFSGSSMWACCVVLYASGVATGIGAAAVAYMYITEAYSDIEYYILCVWDGEYRVGYVMLCGGLQSKKANTKQKMQRRPQVLAMEIRVQFVRLGST